MVLLVTLAIAGPLALGISWRHLPKGLVGGISRVGAVFLCQLSAVSAVGVVVNNSYAFYASWRDLFGVGAGAAGVPQQVASGFGSRLDDPPKGGPGTSRSGAGGSGAGVAQLVSFMVHGRESGVHQDVTAWLPPQYHERAYRHHRFPVLMMLTGYPVSAKATYSHFHFGDYAGSAVASGKVAPFVAVFPPITIAPPRDTECSDVPAGPQALSWLAKDVPAAVAHRLRVDPVGRHWSVMGWSTGGFCAAKMLMRYRSSFRAAVSFGGYYTPIIDHTTGDLFGASVAVRHQNSPLWLLEHAPTVRTNLLVVAGRQDSESYPMSMRFLAAARRLGTPGVAQLIISNGAHNYRIYRLQLPTALSWLARTAQL